jgi:hypothetical protein
MVDEGVVADLDHFGVFKEDSGKNLCSLSQVLELCFPQVIAACD